MGKLSETELKKLIKGGETNTVEFKIAAPRATEMAERLCGLANAQGGMVIIVSSVRPLPSSMGIEASPCFG